MLAVKGEDERNDNKRKARMNTVYFIVLDPPMVAGPPCTFFSRWNQTPNNFLVIDKVTCHNSFCPRRH